jgi:hypothetical protein
MPLRVAKWESPSQERPEGRAVLLLTILALKGTRLSSKSHHSKYAGSQGRESAAEAAGIFGSPLAPPSRREAGSVSPFSRGEPGLGTQPVARFSWGDARPAFRYGFMSIHGLEESREGPAGLGYISYSENNDY